MVCVVARVNLSGTLIGNHAVARHIWDLTKKDVSRPGTKWVLQPGTTG